MVLPGQMRSRIFSGDVHTAAQACSGCSQPMHCSSVAVVFYDLDSASLAPSSVA